MTLRAKSHITHHRLHNHHLLPKIKEHINEQTFFSLFVYFVFHANAQQYEIYDINGKNKGLYNGELNKHTLVKFTKQNLGSVLVKKHKENKITLVKGLNNNQLNTALLSQTERDVNISRDTLSSSSWIEVEKNEIVKLCLDNNVLAWETALNANILNNLCLAFQVPSITGVETIKVHFSQGNEPVNINLAVGMKYLNFNDEEVLLGSDNLGVLRFARGPFIEEDPERLDTVTATYLVDKYPVTICDFVQVMWDSIHTTFTNNEVSWMGEFYDYWLSRKRSYLSNNYCDVHDTATNTIFLFQTLMYANSRSIREGLKPYYKIISTKNTESKILSNGNYALPYFNVSIDYSSDGYRLPFYDEWMMLARGGNKNKKNKGPWGKNDDLHKVLKYANFGTSKKKDDSAPVGNLLPNGYGLFDVFGVVWEHVLFENHNPFKFWGDSPSCMKGGDNHVDISDESSRKEFNQHLYWKEMQYGSIYGNPHSAHTAGFRLIRKLK